MEAVQPSKSMIFTFVWGGGISTSVGLYGSDGRPDNQQGTVGKKSIVVALPTPSASRIALGLKAPHMACAACKAHDTASPHPALCSGDRIEADVGFFHADDPLSKGGQN